MEDNIMLNGSSQGLTVIETRYLESMVTMTQDIHRIASSVKDIADNTRPAPRETYVVVKSARDGSEPVQVSALAYPDAHSAIDALREDYDDEARDHGWRMFIPIEGRADGLTVRSPEDDPDHDYVWRILLLAL